MVSLWSETNTIKYTFTQVHLEGYTYPLRTSLCSGLRWRRLLLFFFTTRTPWTVCTSVKTSRCWFRRSFCAAWTAATDCFKALLRVWWGSFSLSRMRLHVTTTSQQCYSGCTGFRFDVGLFSRWPPWSSVKVVVGCHLPHQGRVLSTCQSDLQQLWRQLFCSCRSELRSCEAAFLLICAKLALTFNGLNSYWRHYWDHDVLWLTVKAAPQLLTYLLDVD